MEYTKELNVEWNSFLVDCWLNHKSATMSLVVNQFNLIHNVNIEKSGFKMTPKEEKAFEFNYDVFRFLAEKSPTVSNYLIDTKKTDTVRIDKIKGLLNKNLINVEPAAIKKVKP